MGPEYDRIMAYKAKFCSDSRHELEIAMGAWEGRKKNPRLTEAAVEGLLVALGSIPGVGGILSGIKTARAQGADAAIRQVYHQALDLTGERTVHQIMDQAAFKELQAKVRVLVSAVERAAGY
jgi:hypothetical protein